MRVLCFTFIVYLVILTTQPCSDMAAMLNDCGDRNLEITHVESTSDSDSQLDDCSPFCICSCCSLSVVDHTVSVGLTTHVENVAILTTLIEYTNPYAKAHQNSIWQPPKA